MKQLIADWCLMLLAVIILVITAVGVCRSDDSPDYLRARAAAAIAIHAAKTDTDRKPSNSPPDKTTAGGGHPTADQGDFVFLTATWCVGPCQPVKDDIASKKFPFPVRVLNIDKEQSPVEVSTVPAFWWRNSDGRAWVYPPPNLPDERRGYPGAEAIVRMWEGTQPREKRASRKVDVIQVTPQQQAMIDKALKAGFTMDEIMQYARSKGLIK